MRTISGRVRPFGQGTEPVFVNAEWPESLDEVDELSERIDGDVERGILVLAAKKGMITLQDGIRSDESWEELFDPPVDPSGDLSEDEKEALREWTEEVNAELQSHANEILAGLVIEAGTFPGESARKKKDKLDEARQDPESAEALIAELRERHGL